MIVSVYNPVSILPNPVQLDYDRGYLFRYFYRKANDPNSQIFETNKDNYELIANHYIYKRFFIKWKIVGETIENIENINSKIAESCDIIFFGIKTYLFKKLSAYGIIGNSIIKMPNINKESFFSKNLGDKIEIINNTTDNSILKTSMISKSSIIAGAFNENDVYFITKDGKIIIIQ